MFANLFNKKKTQENSAAGPQIAQYQCPFPLTGDIVEEKGKLYVTASKADCYSFRQLCDSTENYVLRYEKNGVYAWDTQLKGDSNLLIKTFSTFDVPPEQMYDMLHDGVYRIVWDDARLEGHRIVKLNDHNDIGYYAAKVPSVSNRDFVNQRVWHSAGNGEFVIFNTSVDHTDFPENKKFVRALSRISGYLIRKWGSHGCSVTYLTQSDPKGWLPSTFVNQVTTKFAPSMMEKIRAAAANYASWRAEKGAKWECDWTLPAEPYDQLVEDKTHFYVQKRIRGDKDISPPPPPVLSPAAEDVIDFPSADGEERRSGKSMRAAAVAEESAIALAV